MMDSPSPAAAKSLAPIALAFALVASASPARADQPAAPTPPAAAAPDTAAAVAAPAPAPVAVPEAAAVPPAPPSPPPVAPTPGPAPAPAAAPPSVEASPAVSELARTPLTVSMGQGDKQWGLTFYGFVEANYIMDTTRSYNERIGASLVARSDTYEGRHGRTQFSIRNTRLGL